LRDGGELYEGAVDRHFERGLVLVPTQVFAKERGEVERLQALSHGGNVEVHGIRSVVESVPLQSG
jgi:hypothetical protein